MKTELIRKSSIEELCAHRNRSIELVESAIAFVNSANETAQKAAPMVGHLTSAIVSLTSISRMNNSIKLDEFRKSIDAACWRNLMKVTGLPTLMSASQREAFEKSLYDNPPEFTVENAYATFTDKIANAGEIFNQSIVDVFKRCPRNYKSNNDFRFAEKVIFNQGYNDYSNNWAFNSHGGYCVQEIVKDLDRVMHILDHKSHETDATAFCSLAMKEKKSDCETEYFYFRWFKKGTVHIRFKRRDLVKEMNRILANHYGKTVAHAA